MSEVRIPALAKVNLRLEVLGKRPDGFHELRTIFQSISLKDELRLRSTRKSGIELRVRGNASLSDEPVEKNLVYRAVDALRQEFRHRDGIAMSVQGPTNGTIEYTRGLTRRLAKPARPTAGLQRERCLARFVVSVKPAGGSPWRRRGSKATPRASKERQRGRLRGVTLL